MQYVEFVDIYEKVGRTAGRLEKVAILAEFLRVLKEKGKSKWIYLLNGKVTADYDTREFGISRQLVIKSISSAFGVKTEEIVKRFSKVGDLGEIAEEFVGKKRQSVLFSSKLSVEKVFDTLSKLLSIEGKGAVEKKISLVSELLGQSSGKEAKYIIRTLLGDLRVGVATGVIRDSISEAFFEKNSEMKEKVEAAYDLANDWAIIFDAAFKGNLEIEKIGVVPGRPLNVMLAIKAESIEEAFEICGKPAALEYKYDGFRVVISREKNGKIKLFTRRLGNVTAQFPDVVNYVEKNVKGENFILDCEIVGFDAKTKKYMPFQYISQRIKRKYEIEKIVKYLPVEVNVFDILYYNGESLLSEPFKKRRMLIESIVRKEDWKIKPANQIVVDNVKDAEKFYKEALKMGEEGVMIKKLDAPYKQGRRVGYMVKLKPEIRDFDLVIIGAEYGTGKRAGWLTSYFIACRDESKFLEVGKVSSGLKEIEAAEIREGEITYEQMTKLLKPLIVKTEGNKIIVKPKIVVSVTYQNIQESPSYSSGYALRFPRITSYRPDRSMRDITSLNEMRKEAKKGR